MFNLILIKPARERNAWQETGAAKTERRIFEGFDTYEAAYRYLDYLDERRICANSKGWHFWQIKEIKSNV